jgi:hypothetical protein
VKEKPWHVFIEEFDPVKILAAKVETSQVPHEHGT